MNSIPQKRISSFPPVIHENSKILILGSVPGVKSLEMQQYYGHPQNKFWKIMFEILKEEYSSEYQEKIDLLNRNKIALWDVIDSCERHGSLDSAIKNEEANRIEDLLKSFPNIKAIFCNGQKSFKNLQRLLGKENEIPVVALPSTSPAYAVMSFNQKLKEWKKISAYL